jgi:hypothetical protein
LLARDPAEVAERAHPWGRLKRGRRPATRPRGGAALHKIIRDLKKPSWSFDANP